MIKSLGTVKLNVSDKDIYDAFCKAFKRGHLGVLQWVLLHAPKAFVTMLRAHDYHVVHLAASHGHPEILHWLKKEFGLDDSPKKSYTVH